jgi:hypothetical protein
MTSARRMLRAFYAVVLLVALAGQAIAAVTWLHWPVLLALVAVAAVELGGIALSVHADARRQLGERAIPARLLSAAVAAGAVALNWEGHADRLQGGFFAGMSALGYAVWLIDTAARRRDQLRAARMLPPTAPAYPAWQWLTHPLLTARARTLALVDQTLGLYASLDAARAAVRRERRQASIAKVLHRKIRAATDPTAADIAVAVYDLDLIAARLADGADYDGLTALLAAELVPTAVAGSTVVERESERLPEEPTASADADLDDRPRRLPPAELDRVWAGIVAAWPSGASAQVDAASRDAVDELPDGPDEIEVAARQVAWELYEQGQRITRDNLAAGIRARGLAVSTDRATALARTLRTATAGAAR